MLTRCIYCSYQGLLTQCTLPFPPLHIHLLRPLLFNVHIHSSLHAVIMLFLVFNFLLPHAYLIMPSALCSCSTWSSPFLLSAGVELLQVSLRAAPAVYPAVGKGQHRGTAKKHSHKTVPRTCSHVDLVSGCPSLLGVCKSA